MALQIVTQLLNDLNSNNINYCHWKSNEHITAAMNGDTDLDILFDKKQERTVIEILKRNRFHLFEAVWYRKYKGIVDYIGFDRKAAKIVHIHTHFNLDIGEVGIKSYRMPWEDLILKNRVYDEKLNIYTSSPETEYLLLVVRTAFKHDIANTRSNKNIAKHFNLEAEWLYNRVNTEHLNHIASAALDDEMAGLIAGIRNTGSYDQRLFIALKKLLKPYFANYRLLSSQRVSYLKLVHRVKRMQIKVRKLLRLPPNVSKRSLPQKGIVVCLMGSDGAGKSTQTKALTKELSKKVNVVFMYMGSGDGSISFQRKLISTVISLGAKINPDHKTTNKSLISKEEATLKKDITKKNLFKQLILSLKAVSLAFEKKNRLKQIDRERKKGSIIICDRYPQTSTLGYNDGPQLYANINNANFILRSLAKYEFSCYHLAKQVYPDLVIKLIGSVDVLHSRRPEMSKEVINRKQNGIIDLHFDPPTNVVTLDIDRPMSEIKGRILEAVSNQINKI